MLTELTGQGFSFAGNKKIILSQKTQRARRRQKTVFLGFLF